MKVHTYNRILAGIKYLSILIFGLCFGGCSSTYDIPRNKERNDFVNVARDRIGSSYKYAARGPSKFDCSGLVTFSLDKLSISLKGSSSSMSRIDKGIDPDKVLPGDLVFFKKNGKVFHVSIVSDISRDQLWVIHSTNSQGVIEEEILRSKYWKGKIYKIISFESLTNLR